MLRAITYHRPGDPTEDAFPGDIILTHSSFLSGKIIRFGQRLRWRGDRKWAAYWNHAALVVGDGSGIVEALGHGVQHNLLGKYRYTEYAVIHMERGEHDTQQILDFAASVLREKARYGYLEILSLGLSLLTPPWIQFGTPGTMICSGFVAEAQTRAGSIWPTDPAYIMPAHIAELFEVTSP